jgi:DNA-binding transcriptional LysR family regulator
LTALQEKLDVRLVERIGDPWVLTAEGEIVVGSAAVMEGQVQRLDPSFAGW